MESPAELHFRSYLIDSATIPSHSTHVRFRHSVPLPTSPPREILCVRPSIHNILGLSPSALPNPLPLPVLGRRCRRCRSGSPLRHISGGRKTPVSAFKISLMAAATDRADRATEQRPSDRLRFRSAAMRHRLKNYSLLSFPSSVLESPSTPHATET